MGGERRETHDKWRRDISLGLSSECGEIGNGVHGGRGQRGVGCVLAVTAAAKPQKERAESCCLEEIEEEIAR